MNYKWLPLKAVLQSVSAMDREDVSRVARGKEQSSQTREGFVEAYIATNGSIDKMKKRLTGRNDSETWAERRNGFVGRHLEQMRNADTYKDGWLPNGEPTRRHLGLIAWAYSPSPKRLGEWLKTQPKAWKQFVSNPPEQLRLDFTEYDSIFPSLPKDVVMQVVFAVNDKEEGKETVVIGNEDQPKNKAISLAIDEGYLLVDDIVDHSLSGMKMWIIVPSRKGFNLVNQRRKKQAEKEEQLRLFPNPRKSVNVAIHLVSSSGVHEKIGDIKLSDTSQGLRIDTDLHNLPTGFHGTHIHEYGDLSPLKKGDKIIAAGKAGQHYDPENAGFHGHPNGYGHRGDLPKIHADEYGTSQQTLYAPRLSLDEIKGRSIVIHRYGDNYSDTPLPNGGGKERIAGGIITSSCPHCRSNPETYVPERYLKGYKGRDREKRRKEIIQRNKEIDRAMKKYGSEKKFPQYVKRMLYRPFITDSVKPKGRSPTTVEAEKRGFNVNIPSDRIIPIAKKMGIVTQQEINDTKISKNGKKDKKGRIPKYVPTLLKKAINASIHYNDIIPFDIVDQSYDRGAAAWKTGHAKGMTSEGWGFARVNSFLVGGKTFFTSDKDLASKLPKSVQKDIIKNRVWRDK